MAYDVFLSHSSKDRATVDVICEWLEREGIRCWIAPRDISPGSSWGASIVQGIRQSPVMVLVFSEHANASPQIKREVERAVHFNHTIIPVRVEDVMPDDDLEYFLGMPHWLDAFKPPLERHLPLLVTAVRGKPPGPCAEAAAPARTATDRHVAAPTRADAGPDCGSAASARTPDRGANRRRADFARRSHHGHHGRPSL